MAEGGIKERVVMEERGKKRTGRERSKGKSRRGRAGRGSNSGKLNIKMLCFTE